MKAQFLSLILMASSSMLCSQQTWAAVTGIQSTIPVEVMKLATPEQIYQMALEERTEKNYTRMIELLRIAARAGDVASQELLSGLLMAGAPVYGKAVSSGLCEAAYWNHQARNQGSIVAANQALVLNNLRFQPKSQRKCPTWTY